MQNSQLRSLALAFAGGVAAAAATMFVPTALLESLTGPTGLSEIIPVTAPPLGDTARAIIAFVVGALVLVGLSLFLLRRDMGVQHRTAMPETAPAIATGFDRELVDEAPVYQAPASEDLAYEAVDVEGRPSLIDRLKSISLPKFALPKMPWVKGEDDITDLADLPRLRGGDAHPDAPARRPLIASEDLPDYASPAAVIPTPVVESAPAFEVATDYADQVVAEDAVEEASADAAIDEVASRLNVGDIPDAGYQPTLAEMVAQLEAAVTERQKQLDALETVATRLTSAPSELVEIEEVAETEILPPKADQRRSEAAPAEKPVDEDLDAALSAALETLHRMNATTH